MFYKNNIPKLGEIYKETIQCNHLSPHQTKNETKATYIDEGGRGNNEIYNLLGVIERGTKQHFLLVICLYMSLGFIE